MRLDAVDALSRSETREARDFAFVYICKSSARNPYHFQLSHASLYLKQ